MFSAPRILLGQVNDSGAVDVVDIITRLLLKAGDGYLFVIIVMHWLEKIPHARIVQSPLTYRKLSAQPVNGNLHPEKRKERRMPIDEKTAKDEFYRDGFVVFHDFLSEEEVARIDAALER